MQKLFAVELIFVMVLLYVKKDGVDVRLQIWLCTLYTGDVKLSALKYFWGQANTCREIIICETLKCYVCRSDSDEGCGGDVNRTYSKECPQNNSTKVYCRKISQKLKFKDQTHWTSIRECAYERDPSGCYHFKWFDIGHQETCECEGENCNRGSSFAPTAFTVTIVFSLARIFNYLKTGNT